jgi:Flp pilus assembly protein TadG
MVRREQIRRHGIALVIEAAFVYPIMLLLLLGLIVGGIGVLRYQQAACLAQEAARWASVRGSDYQKDSGQSSPTQQDIVTNAVTPLAAGMDPAALSVQVQWINEVSGQAAAWDSSSKAVTSMTASGAPVTNRVRVTVTYRWLPPLIFVGPLNLSSTAEAAMSY